MHPFPRCTTLRTVFLASNFRVIPGPNPTSQEAPYAPHIFSSDSFPTRQGYSPPIWWVSGLLVCLVVCLSRPGPGGGGGLPGIEA